MRAFPVFKLPVGGYQFVNIISDDDTDSYNLPSDARMVHIECIAQNIDGNMTPFENHRVVLFGLDDEAQRALINVLEANLADNAQKAMMVTQEVDYARIEP